MKTKSLALLLTFSLAAVPALADELSARAAIGGGLGGALGGFLGAELGGRGASILGSGLGAATGTAVATDGYDRPYRYYPVRGEHHHRGPPGKWKKKWRYRDYDD